MLIYYYVYILQKKTLLDPFLIRVGVIRIRKSKNDIPPPKKKVQKYKQRSTKHTHKTKDRVTRATPKTGVNSCVKSGRAKLVLRQGTNITEHFHRNSIQGKQKLINIFC
jgi:hypothetical protein